MKKIFVLCVGVCMSVFYEARADFWEICTAVPGELCWGMIAGQDDNTGHDGVNYDEWGEDYYMVRCEMNLQYIDGPAKNFLTNDALCFDNLDGPYTCLYYRTARKFDFCVGDASYNMYVEDFPCDFCRGNNAVSIADWSDRNVNNAISKVSVSFDNVMPATCVAKENMVWGCPTGYYYVSGSGSSTVCAQCPSGATCTDSNGHTISLKYKCSDGYFYNGTTCEQCPLLGGVYGVTGKIGAQSITECYIPSGTTFSDDSGSGTYTADCYYSE